MIELRKFASLGHVDHGWLKAAHHFSFAGYSDPDRAGWGRLRVWNDDEIAAGAGFSAHAHRDMEIVTYVRSGTILHRDSLGNEGRTEAGQVQVMSAGSGIVHSETNPGPEPTTLFQIWITPDRRGHVPSWGMRAFPVRTCASGIVTLASGMENDGEALPINASARVRAAALSRGESLSWLLEPDWCGYAVLASGAVSFGGVSMKARDAVAVRDELEIDIFAEDPSEVVIVETKPF